MMTITSLGRIVIVIPYYYAFGNRSNGVAHRRPPKRMTAMAYDETAGRKFRLTIKNVRYVSGDGVYAPVYASVCVQLVSG